MNAPPTPISARLAISIPAEPASGRQRRAEAEDRQAEVQRPAAAEAVTERAGREQQAGEDEHVGVDDPLQLRARGMKVALERGERNIEDRVVERDDEQRKAQDDERPPAAGIGGFGSVGCITGSWAELMKRNEVVSFIRCAERRPSCFETQGSRFESDGTCDPSHARLAAHSTIAPRPRDRACGAGGARVHRARRRAGPARRATTACA